MIHELFEKQVERSPDAIAVIFEGNQLTYRDLNSRSDQLAQNLRALGVGPDVLVALFLERSLDMVVGMLGVLKAGGAYIPLDPTHPSDRIAFVLDDAQPLLLLTHAQLQSNLPAHCPRVVTIGSVPAELPVEPAPAAQRTSTPNDLAYVIYTSGTTGKPKGVEIEHRAVINFLASMQRQPGLGTGDTMLAITTLAFDIAVLEIFLPLACGASIVIASAETTRDGAALADLIKRCGVTVMQATPSSLRMLLDIGWIGAPQLKILCGGEAWNTELANLLLTRCGSLWNMYGPTETTVWSAVAKVEAGRPIAIGLPVANTRLYVLDRALQLVPVGVPGELYIGGGGLARGYLHQPELTRERFIPDPYAAEPGARMYRTGDSVRRLTDGTLEFLGRLDHQVKIRGYRVELGEIESVLAALPGVREAVVVAREDVPGDKRLVAYLTAHGEEKPKDSELRGPLRAKLPEYMVPSAFVTLDRLPLTPNGKVDRKALPQPDRQSNSAGFVPPASATEEALAKVWGEVLGIRQVGRHDDFFQLGGHSLLATRVVSRIYHCLQVALPLRYLFEAPTVASLAERIETLYRVRRSQSERLDSNPMAPNKETLVEESL